MSKDSSTFNVTSLLLLASLALAGCRTTAWTGPVTTPGQYYLELEHDGLVRSYELHVPTTYTGENSVPLQFDLHPWFTNGSLMERMTSVISAAKGTEVAFRDGPITEASEAICCVVSAAISFCRCSLWAARSRKCVSSKSS